MGEGLHCTLVWMILQTKHEITSIHLNDGLHCLDLASTSIMSRCLYLSPTLFLSLSVFLRLSSSLHCLTGPLKKSRLRVAWHYWLLPDQTFSHYSQISRITVWMRPYWLGLWDKKKSCELIVEGNRCKWWAINYMWQESNSVSLAHKSLLQHLMSLIWATHFWEELPSRLAHTLILFGFAFFTL